MSTTRKHVRSAGYSLIEMLVVISIIAALMALAAPTFSRLLQGSALTRSGQEMLDVLSSACDEAQTRNRKVSVRLIKLPGADGVQRYNAMQTWVAKDDSGTMVPLTKVIVLPDGIVFSETAALVPLLKSAAMQTGSMTVYGVLRDYISFSITATGALETTISGTESFMTLVQQKDAASAAPSNFYSIFINPETGKVSAYRP